MCNYKYADILAAPLYLVYDFCDRADNKKIQERCGGGIVNHSTPWCDMDLMLLVSVCQFPRKGFRSFTQSLNLQARFSEA